MKSEVNKVNSCFSFSSLRFVRLEDLLSASLPLLPSEFEEFVQRQCQTTREELVQKWVLPVFHTISEQPVCQWEHKVLSIINHCNMSSHWPSELVHDQERLSCCRCSLTFPPRPLCQTRVRLPFSGLLYIQPHFRFPLHPLSWACCIAC